MGAAYIFMLHCLGNLLDLAGPHLYELTEVMCCLLAWKINKTSIILRAASMLAFATCIIYLIDGFCTKLPDWWIKAHPYVIATYWLYLFARYAYRATEELQTMFVCMLLVVICNWTDEFGDPEKHMPVEYMIMYMVVLWGATAFFLNRLRKSHTR